MSDSTPQHLQFESKPKRQRIVSNRVRAYQQKQQDKSNDHSGNESDADSTLCILDATQALPPIPRNFEYLDHTADIIFSGYGQTAEQTFESITYAMISYMFDYPERTHINPLLTHTIHIEAQDIPELVFRYLTEILVQSINYYDDLPSSLRKKLGNVGYPGMLPRLVKVLNFSEEMVHPSSSSTVLQPPVDNSTLTDNTQEEKHIEKEIGDEQKPKSKSYRKFILDVEIQGDFIDTIKLGPGTEVKAITRELTYLQTISDPEVKKNKGNFQLQVLVDI